MEQIQYIGLQNLEVVEKEMVEKLTAEYYNKIHRALKNDVSLKIHLKEYKKEGARHKYSLQVKAVAPTKLFESEVSDWDLASVLHKAFQNIEKEIEHTFKD